MNQFPQTTYGGWGNAMNSFSSDTYGGWDVNVYVTNFVHKLETKGYTTSYSLCLENGGWAVLKQDTNEIIKNPASEILEECGIGSGGLTGFMLSLQVLGHFSAACPNPTLRSGYLYILKQLEVLCKFQNLQASSLHGPEKHQYYFVGGKKDTAEGKKGYKSATAWKGQKRWSDVYAMTYVRLKNIRQYASWQPAILRSLTTKGLNELYKEFEKMDIKDPKAQMISIGYAPQGTIADPSSAEAIAKKYYFAAPRSDSVTWLYSKGAKGLQKWLDKPPYPKLPKSVATSKVVKDYGKMPWGTMSEKQKTDLHTKRSAIAKRAAATRKKKAADAAALLAQQAAAGAQQVANVAQQAAAAAAEAVPKRRVENNDDDEDEGMQEAMDEEDFTNANVAKKARA